jgi:sodium transport system ATP-binding protein
MISVQGLGKSFDDSRRGTVWAVRDVSFECRPGEIFGLLGLNGAGKTTTMRVLSTVLEPSEGRAIVAGFDVALDAPAVRRSIGFLSGNTGLYDRMTAWEHVEYFGRLHGLRGDHLNQRMEAVFSSLSANGFRDVLAARMSTGMKQKVSIARAMVHDPAVLIFDEPTSGLDAIVTRAVLDEVRRLRDAGKCLIYSTHIMSEIEKLCDRVGVIHRGRMLACDRLDTLRERFGVRELDEVFFRLIDEADRDLEPVGLAGYTAR